MEQKLSFTSLGIEVTRNCNLSCRHCLRGDAQDMIMPINVLRQFLSQVSDIGQAVFSGGEPALALDVIRRFYLICREFNIPVRSFYLATNGTVNQKDLAAILLDAYNEADECDKDACAVSISTDGFHPAGRASGLLRGLKFYDGSKEQAPGDGSWILPVGRAYENGLGSDANLRVNEKFDVTQFPNGPLVDAAYLSANGMLYPDFNMSYEDMDAALDGHDDCPTQAVPSRTCLKVFLNAAYGDPDAAKRALNAEYGDPER